MPKRRLPGASSSSPDCDTVRRAGAEPRERRDLNRGRHALRPRPTRAPSKRDCMAPAAAGNRSMKNLYPAAVDAFVCLRVAFAVKNVRDDVYE